MGLSLANQPWSGYYSIGKNTWVMAHTTQFTAPGWKYLDSSSGYIGGNRTNGSYVSLKSTEQLRLQHGHRDDGRAAAQTLNFNVTGGLSTGAVHVWSTDVNSNNPADHFVHTADITPSGGAFSLTVQPGYLYTLTTTTGQGKGTATGPAQGALALPYSDSFDGYATGTEAEVPAWTCRARSRSRRCGGGRSGSACARCARRSRSPGTTLTDPHALLGDMSWSNYTVSSDVLLETVRIRRARSAARARQDLGTGSAERLPPAGQRHRSLVDPAQQHQRQRHHPAPAARAPRWAPTAGTPWP